MDAWLCFLPARRVAQGAPGCVRAYRAASGLRADLRAALQGHVRTCVRTCASRVGTCVRLCAADSAAPTPLRPLRIASLADEKFRRAERNLMTYQSNDLKFSQGISKGTRIGDQGTAVNPQTDARLLPMLVRLAVGRARIGCKPSGCHSAAGERCNQGDSSALCKALHGVFPPLHRVRTANWPQRLRGAARRISVGRGCWSTTAKQRVRAR
jgi:hypothetical protein